MENPTTPCLTEREKFLLFQSLEWDLYCYLLSNTHGRECGHERAMRHLKISEKILSFILCEDWEKRKPTHLRKVIHDYLAEILTDRMDEKIGFPIWDPNPDYDLLERRFFQVVVDHFGEMENRVKAAMKISG